MLTRGVNNPWTIQLNPGGGTRGLYWITGNGSIGASITANVWHHVAITHPGGNAAIYLDGNLAAQGNAVTIRVPSTLDVYVGKRPDGNALTGLIDDLALFDLALTQPQIIDHMQHGASANLLPAVPAVLSIQQNGATIQISWTSGIAGFKLQENSNIASPANWTAVLTGSNSPLTLSIG